MVLLQQSYSQKEMLLHFEPEKFWWDTLQARFRSWVIPLKPTFCILRALFHTCATYFGLAAHFNGHKNTAKLLCVACVVFSFSAHLSSATIAWRLLGKKSLTHRTRPWAHAGVAESHWSNQCHWESKSQGHGTGCYNSNKTLTMQTCNQKSEISRYDMVSSDIIVATCHDSVSSHLMSFCMQLWHNGQVAWAIFHTDTYTLRTKTNCRLEDLEALQKSAGLASMLCMLFTVYQTLKCEALPWQR